MAEPTIRIMSASVKTSPGSLSGDVTVQEVNQIIEEQFVSKGYKLHSTNAYFGDNEAFRVYFCFVKEA